MVRLQDTGLKELVIDEAKFFYRLLDAEKEGELYGKVMKISPEGHVIKWDAGALIYRTIETGIEGWENVKDSGGKTIEFKKDLIKFLPKEVRDLLYEAITKTKLTPAESKN